MSTRMTTRVKSAAAMPAIMLGLFGLYTLEFGVVGILPMIVERFGITVSQAGWLMAVFALVVATLGPVLVLISSRFDRKKVLVLALFGFAVCSALAAYAPNFPSLMALRVIPAMLHPVFLSAAFTAAASLYPKEQRAHAISLAFVGTSMGLVLGVPATTWVADHLSYEASFLFCTALTGLSGVGLWAMLPSQGKPVAMSFGHQLSVLRKPVPWLTMAATITVFTAMFSVYSYAAEYLKTETGMNATTISLILVIFGVGGVAGNLYAGRLLARHLVRTTFLHPVALGIAYGVLYYGGSANVASMAVIAVLWGAAHTSGLLVTQMWLTATTAEAPEFGTSLFVSAANGGVVLGSALGGVFIDHLGIAGVIACGVLFCGLSVVVIGATAWIYRETPLRIGAVGAAH